MARRTSGSSSTVNKTGFGISLRCGACDFVASYGDCYMASASFRDALKLQFLMSPCPALWPNGSQSSHPRMNQKGLRPQVKSTVWAVPLGDPLLLNGGRKASSPRYCADPVRP